jgi:uncharacterized protein
MKPTSCFGPLRLLVLQPSPFCNLDCSYCYLPDRSNRSIMPIDLVSTIFTKIFTSGISDKHLTIVWHAGEPLAVPLHFYAKAFELISKLNEQITGGYYKLTHCFQTNATLLNHAWCNFIQAHSIRVGVSLDGPAFIHDSHRLTRKGLGSYLGTSSGISLLQAHDIPFHVISVLTYMSLSYPEILYNYFLEHNISRIAFNIEEQEGAHQNSSCMQVDYHEKYIYFMKTFYDLVRTDGGKINVREFDNIRNLISNAIPEYPSDQTHPFTILTIGYHGECTTFSPELLSSPLNGNTKFTIGNINKDTIEAMMKNQNFQSMYVQIQEGVELCKETCPYFSVCGGGAPSNKYFENGSFLSTETLYCRCNTKALTNIILPDVERQLAAPSSIVEA